MPEAGALGLDLEEGVGVPSSGGGDHGGHLDRVDPVGQIRGREQVGGGNGHRPQLVEAHQGVPILIVPLQQQHDPVPFRMP